ncbi:MAG: hypothetical protein FGM15_10630 [Chthoniobacterales bacterium]|nr:hypothetical protein [Chthoniobacterales bacterium]
MATPSSHQRILRVVALLVAPLLTVGCSVVGVKVRKSSAAHTETRQLIQANGENRAALLLKQATQPGVGASDQLSALLEAVHLTRSAAPGSEEHKLNRAASEEIVRIMKAENFAPARLPDGRALTVAGDSPTTLDPRVPDELLAASSIQIKKLRVRTVQDGAGVPCVARFAPKSSALRGQPGITPLAGVCEPVTALVRFDGGNPQLVFYRTREDDEVLIEGRKVKLAADFSAPLAYMVSKGRNRIMAVREMFRSDINMGQAGLYQFSVYDPGKIPVVFVHGLMSRPETWVPAVNELLADKEIRERYQFWFFLYPTGLPVWASAAKLRSELDRYRVVLDPQRVNRNFDRTVLAGHSMGGLISGLQIRTGGKHLWRQFLKTPPEQMNVSPRLKEHIIRIVEFHPRPEVARVVFFATPHRGSELAVNPFAEFFARLVRLPFGFLRKDMMDLQKFLHDDVRELFVAPANSLVFLRARSPLLAAIMKLPMRGSTPYHSVIGDRGRGDTPDSSDGVVPYWSSHLEGAASEKIVPSGHGTNENPEGVQEFRRILRLHLKRS